MNDNSIIRDWDQSHLILKLIACHKQGTLHKLRDDLQNTILRCGVLHRAA